MTTEAWNDPSKSLDLGFRKTGKGHDHVNAHSTPQHIPSDVALALRSTFLLSVLVSAADLVDCVAHHLEVSLIVIPLLRGERRNVGDLLKPLEHLAVLLERNFLPYSHMLYIVDPFVVKTLTLSLLLVEGLKPKSEIGSMIFS